jgi:hypothetical protein
MIRKSSAIESSSIMNPIRFTVNLIGLLDLPPEILTNIISRGNKSAIARICKNIKDKAIFDILSVKDAVIINDYYSLSKHPFMKNVIAFYAAKHGNVKILEKCFPTDPLYQREILYELGCGCLIPIENDKFFSKCYPEIWQECDFTRGKISVGKIPDMFSTYMIEKLFEEFDTKFAKILTYEYADSVDEYYKKIGTIANTAISLSDAECIYNNLTDTEKMNPRTITAFARRREILEQDFKHLHKVCPLVWREHLRDDYLGVIALMINKNPYTHQIKDVILNLIDYCCEWEKYDLIDKLHAIVQCKIDGAFEITLV